MIASCFPIKNMYQNHVCSKETGRKKTSNSPQTIQTPRSATVAFSHVLSNKLEGVTPGSLPAQLFVAGMHTFLVQQVPTAHTDPATQSALVSQSASPAHGVAPSPHTPVPSNVLAHTQLPPGPQAVNVSHVWPVHESLTHEELWQMPLGQTLPHRPQLFGSVTKSLVQGFV